ncbi:MULTISPECIES: hypothetical protein [unclassified Sphingomonas]|uniref:hypothetical protein n=1 Tax=unclassified Sphingomonas TaxID=196159 RepID=UPI0006F1FE44|nr:MULTISPECIES: hypothetical protein [unclassified Sphingomonas]KQX25041.1 hypothetical protein ASD17_23470 [Sphingomonas sp. Root1294]KQY66058.1 hypothetical protein ASD39_13270 [Sphingomonas sp. Root50]KRB89778.1 hypothetical protein ASE22_19325 [Sphingomonas sp. Root720]
MEIAFHDVGQGERLFDYPDRIAAMRGLPEAGKALPPRQIVHGPDDATIGPAGEIHAGIPVGHESPDQMTTYKSLLPVVQDLATTAYVHARATSEGSAA